MAKRKQQTGFLDEQDEAEARRKIMEDSTGDDFRSNATSLLTKTIRLGQPKEALDILCKMLHRGTSPSYIAKRLWVSSFEDCDDPQAAIFAHSVYTFTIETSYQWLKSTYGGWERVYKDKPDLNGLYYGVYWMAKNAKKFYATEGGREFDTLLRSAFAGAKENPTWPSWCLDTHSATGRALAKLGQEPDMRASGEGTGRYYLCRYFEKHGKIDMERTDAEMLRESQEHSQDF